MYRGDGHEAKDLSRLLELYVSWQKRLAPDLAGGPATLCLCSLRLPSCCRSQRMRLRPRPRAAPRRVQSFIQVVESLERLGSNRGLQAALRELRDKELQGPGDSATAAELERYEFDGGGGGGGEEAAPVGAGAEQWGGAAGMVAGAGSEPPGAAPEAEEDEDYFAAAGMAGLIRAPGGGGGGYHGEAEEDEDEAALAAMQEMDGM